MKCKICGKERHYCSNCDRDYVFDLEYCSVKCFNQKFGENCNVKSNIDIFEKLIYLDVGIHSAEEFLEWLNEN